jgi:hypothetical protein
MVMAARQSRGTLTVAMEAADPMLQPLHFILGPNSSSVEVWMEANCAIPASMVMRTADGEDSPAYIDRRCGLMPSDHPRGG